MGLDRTARWMKCSCLLVGLAVAGLNAPSAAQDWPFPLRNSLASPQTPPPPGVAPPPVPLRVEGRHFVDPTGRVVLLRGVNLSGDAKVPPFLHCRSVSDLDPLVDHGFNVIRLVFIWEAFEPSPGLYNDHYLATLEAIADAAYERGMYTIIDIHQDGFSRYTAKGAGDGFPAWAVSMRARLWEPDNGPKSKNWPVKMFTDPAMHRSFEDFYADVMGTRSRFLGMIDRVASYFADVPGVIGYDLLNEPHGDEQTELAPLYGDVAEVIRRRDATAILFVQGHITTNSGFQTFLPRLPHDGIAYAPHYYNLTTIVLGSWHHSVRPMNRAFSAMSSKAEEWNVPLFVGEFGMAAEVWGVRSYMREVYDRLDETLASGTQWNYTPNWTEHRLDGWNMEDFNILHPEDDRPRPNFEPRPYPRATAGTPLFLDYQEPEPKAPDAVLTFAWDHIPALGVTEVFLPNIVFSESARIQAEPHGVRASRDSVRQVVRVQSDRPARILLKVESESRPR